MLWARAGRCIIASRGLSVTNSAQWSALLCLREEAGTALGCRGFTCLERSRSHASSWTVGIAPGARVGT